MWQIDPVFWKIKNIGPWCNGNTTGFDPVIGGSSPPGPAILRSLRFIGAC